ncbi:Outer membrane protein SusF, partial [termite gut metagenome]
MKKISLYITMFLAVCLLACTEDFNEDVAAPQSYPEESPQVINGFAIALDGGFTSPVVLKNLEENASIQAVKATATPEMTEGASVTFRLQLSDTESFTRIIDLPSQSENNAAVVDASDLNGAVKELFGKAPNPRAIHLRAYVYILDGTSASQLPDPVSLGTVTVTPIAPNIEQAYYLIGTPNDWEASNVSTLIAFNHSGNDVYEDSYFTLLVESPGDCYWKVVPQSIVTAVETGVAESVWIDGVLGTEIDSDASLEGKLDVKTTGAMKIADKGWAKITLNMMESTYTVEVIGEMKLQLYVAGAHQGWDPAAAPIVYSRNFDMKYDGYV